ncbi:uncharacterized protein [Antedon mediterranea]|uniref:uncharacterized protein n=1 Tax=Antedon mediterranea TaxID=105859 RepID=UPI003AF9DB06
MRLKNKKRKNKIRKDSLNIGIDDYETTLTRKLKELQNATKNAMKQWNKSIMFVWAESPRIADLINSAWENIKEALKTNTILIVVLVKEEHCSMFDNNKRNKKTS